MTLIIHASPRPFEEEHERIQRNAISSWDALRDTRVVLFGKESGEYFETLSGSWIPNSRVVPEEEIRRICGYPTLNSLIVPAEDQKEGDVYAYVNSDIILQPPLRDAVDYIAETFDRFLIIGQRIDTIFRTDFYADEPSWERLRSAVSKTGVPHPAYGIDVFIYKGDVWGNIPEFVIGCTVFDNWLVGAALKRGVPVIDVTPYAPFIHQGFSYRERYTDGDIHNRFLVVEHPDELKPSEWFDDDVTGGYIKTVDDATHVLTGEGVLEEKSRYSGIYVTTPYAAPPTPRWWRGRERIMTWAYQNVDMVFTEVRSKNSVAHNHNEGIEDALRTSAEYVLMMDSDALIHPDGVGRMLSRKKDVVVPLMFRNRPPYTPTLYTRLDESSDNPNMCFQDFEWLRAFLRDNIQGIQTLDEPHVLRRVNGDPLVRLVRSGTHTMLLHRRVLEGIDPPWFETEGKSGAGSDMDFCRKIIEAGFEIYADCSVVSGHLLGEYCVGVLDWLAWDAITRYTGPKGLEIKVSVPEPKD